MTKIAKKIKDLRTMMNLKQRELAEKIGGGVLQSTVSQWERGKQEPNAENNLKLANLAGVAPHEWLNLPALGESTVRQRRVPVVGVLQAGAWREAVEFPEDDQRLIEAPIPDMIDGIPTRRLELQAFEVSGSSMNRVYPEGTIVYAASTMSYREPESDDRVIVIRRDKHGLVEATLKELIIGDDGKKWLWPRSYDPEHQAPLPYANGDDVTVSGIVVAALVLEESRKRRR
jgi:transcriptional regulator with XRE-family HTH domain